MNERENIGMLKKWFFKLYIPDRRTFQECKPDIASFLEKLLFDTQKDNVPAYYEILSDHENEDVRKLAADILEINSTRIDVEKVRKFCMEWLKYPIKNFIPTVKKWGNVLNNSQDEKDKAILIIAEMFEDNQSRVFQEEELVLVEDYIRDKPLLYKPIQRKVDEFRNRQISQHLTREQMIVQKVDSSYQIDTRNLLFSRDLLVQSSPRRTWEKLLNSSIITIVEYFFQVMSFKKWRPASKEERKLFDLLLQSFPLKSWHAHEDNLLLLLDSSMDNVIRYNVDIKLNPFLLAFPERVNLVDLDQSNISYTTLEKSETRKQIKFIYNDDLELLTIEVDSDLDIDVIKDENEGFFIGGDALKLNLSLFIAIVKPISYLTAEDIEVLTRVSCVAETTTNPKFFKFAYFLQTMGQILASKHYLIEKKPSLKSLPKTMNVIQDTVETSQRPVKGKQNITLAIDFGTFKSAISAINNSTRTIISGYELINSTHASNYMLSDHGAIVPSIIFYDSVKGEMYGSRDEKDLKDIHVIWGMKSKIKNNVVENEVIQGRVIDLQESIKKFFKFLRDSIDTARFDVFKIGFAFPIDSSPEYQAFLKESIACSFNMDESRIFYLDEASANCLGHSSLKEFQVELGKAYLVIDIGGGTTDVGVIVFKSQDGRDIEVYARGSDNTGGNTIEKFMHQSWSKQYDFLKDTINKDKFLYLLSKKKIELSKGLKKGSFFFEGESFDVTLTDFEDSFENSSIPSRIEQILDSTLTTAKHRGIQNPEQVILAGGAFKFKPLQLMVKKLLNERFGIDDGKIIEVQNDHSIALGLLHISKGYSIKATTMDDIVVKVSDDDSDGFKFETIIKKDTDFPTPFYRLAIASESTGTIRSIRFTLHSVREFTDSNEADLDLSRERKTPTSVQVLEKLTLQDIEIPILDASGNSQEIFIQINDRKEIMVYYKDKEMESVLHEHNMGMIR